MLALSEEPLITSSGVNGYDTKTNKGKTND